MRVASAVIGAFGAFGGVAKGLFFFNGLLGVVLLGQWEFHSYHALWMGLEGGTVIFCLLALAGVGFTIADRLRVATRLMFASAAGVIASVGVFVLLRPSLLRLLDEPTGYPLSTGSYILHLFPVPLLLIGAALALLARRSYGAHEGTP